MIISVASGKGGTGKTTLSTSLASVLGKKAQLIDCDVEEPNCHILMKPDILKTETVGLPIPVIDNDKCNLCGKCGEVCKFSAILVLADQVLTFPEMCHGCGGCSLLCPGPNALVYPALQLARLRSAIFRPTLARCGLERCSWPTEE